ncbi:MAG TPA: response regulator [Candidatus Ozemobacteraceae bacterium]|nr:response regulator [Candidatus Ozemobacteraceae bacterium]
MNILVLDDREDGRYMLEVLLRGNGYTVESVSNGVRALEKLKEARFDLIISDILMPVMDGFQFCRKVKADAALSGIPFIFYTATYTSAQDEKLALQIGADRFIRKPCEPDEIIAAIAAFTSGKQSAKGSEQNAPAADEDILRLYNERLVHKLEQKMLEAEQASQALIEERKRFQHLVDELPLGVVLVDREGMFRYINPRFVQLFGYEAADMPTIQAWREKALVDSREREEIAERWRQAGEADRDRLPDSWMVRIRCRDGALKQVRYHPSFLANGDQIITFEDASEQVRMEAKLRQAQKMEAIATLAGGIAHDFNNILAAVMGFAELAQHAVDPTGDAAKHIAKIMPAALRAKHLVAKILAFSRQSEQERVHLAVHLVIEEVVSLLRSTLPATIEIRQKINRDCVALADPTQIHQVVMNLCTNAFHAMRDKGGLLEITLTRETLTPLVAKSIPGLAPGDYVKLTIRDTGCGMSPEVLAKIFDPYFTTKAEGEGTGLGLSVSHGIVRSHNGAIDVSSEIGKGSIFDVYLPQMDMPAEKSGANVEEKLPTGTERILFIDDEPGLTALVREILPQLGYTVETSGSAEDALQVIRDHPGSIDLIITDLAMPRMTGFDLAVEMRRLNIPTPMILCSGTATSQVAKQAAECGFRDFLGKPFTRRDLAVAVRRVLDHLR